MWLELCLPCDRKADGARIPTGGSEMEQARNDVCDVAGAICDAFNQIGDFSYAVMPKDLAHAVGDFKKAVLTTIRSAVNWEIEWIDGRVAGGDKLREEWRERCQRESTTDTTTALGV
jgi:hypothetical protein